MVKVTIQPNTSWNGVESPTVLCRLELRGLLGSNGLYMIYRSYFWICFWKFNSKIQLKIQLPWRDSWRTCANKRSPADIGIKVIKVVIEKVARCNQWLPVVTSANQVFNSKHSWHNHDGTRPKHHLIINNKPLCIFDSWVCSGSHGAGRWKSQRRLGLSITEIQGKSKL